LDTKYLKYGDTVRDIRVGTDLMHNNRRCLFPLPEFPPL
jgi:hypothetical protein